MKILDSKVMFNTASAKEESFDLVRLNIPIAYERRQFHWLTNKRHQPVTHEASVPRETNGKEKPLEPRDPVWRWRK